MRSCFRRPDEPSILRPSAISWSSLTDFRFNSAISTLCGEKRGRSLLGTERDLSSERCGGERDRVGRRGGEGPRVAARGVPESNGEKKCGQVRIGCIASDDSWRL